MAASDCVQEMAAVDLGALLDAGDGAVVTLIAGETRLAAHKAVLSARSPVFKAMFQQGTLEATSSQVAIPDVEGPVLRQLLVYMYTLQAPQLPSMASQLLAAAAKYSLSALQAACEQQVAKELTVENAATTAVLAVRHSCTSLRQAAIAFIRAHLEVMATQSWGDAMLNQPKELIEVSRMVATPPAEPSAGAGAQGHPRSQPHSSLSLSRSHGRTPPKPDGGAASHLWSLSSDEKGSRLMQAAKEGRVEELEVLLAAGTDVDARDGDRMTALQWAAYRGHMEVVRRLLGAGAEVDARDVAQWTPLHFAAGMGHAAVVRLLAAASADLNAKCESGSTALHVAAFNGQAETAAALLDAGSDRGARNEGGRTPLDIARGRRYQQLIDLLT